MAYSRLADPEYEQWLKVGRGLLRLKHLIVPETEKVIRAFQARIIAGIAGLPPCSCKHTNIDRTNACMQPPCPRCDPPLTQIIHASKQKRNIRAINLQNSIPSLWATDMWEIAKCYMGKGLKETNHGAGDTDTSNLLIMWNSCSEFDGLIGNRALLQDVLTVRNDTMHSPGMQCSQADMMARFGAIINLLNDTKLSSHLDSSAVASMEAIRDTPLVINVDVEMMVWSDLINSHSNTLEDLISKSLSQPITEFLNNNPDLLSQLQQQVVVLERKMDEQDKRLDSQQRELHVHEDILSEIPELQQSQQQQVDVHREVLEMLLLRVDEPSQRVTIHQEEGTVQEPQRQDEQPDEMENTETGLTKRTKLLACCGVIAVLTLVGLSVGVGLVYRGVDHCASSPCQNGGECFAGLESFRCNCTSAFTGAYCQTDINECSSSPCRNGGLCFDGSSSYQCACAMGYTGVHCEINTNECSPNPCYNGGSCTDGINSYQCACAAGYTGAHCEIMTHRDCKEVRTMSSVSGVYTVTPCGGSPTQVYCDMDMSGGGWLVFQKRVDGSVDFYLNWTSYAVGFGDLNGEFWLGNRNLHLLTAQKSYTLRVVLSDWEGNQRYAQYMNFTIGSEQDKFRLTVGAYSGTAGDSLSYNSGRPFSTRDQDNDVHSGGAHCAQLQRSAWWHGACSPSNLNGRYYPAGPYSGEQSQTGVQDGVFCLKWKLAWYSLKKTRMMLRPAP